MINRIGNKRRIADKIIPLFPEHKTYIEMFFGGGGMFFKKPKAKYNIVNDNSADVFNLFVVVNEKYDDLINYILTVPLHSEVMNYWMCKQESDPVKKATRFLYLSHFAMYGNYEGRKKSRTMDLSVENSWDNIIAKLYFIQSFIKDVIFLHKDFRNVLSCIPKGDIADDAFIYADPPYLESTEKYYKTGWKEQDTVDLFEVLVSSGIRFAMSEYNNPVVLELAKKHNLEVHKIADVYAMSKAKRTEILITNYDVYNKQLELLE